MRPEPDSEMSEGERYWWIVELTVIVLGFATWMALRS